MSMSLKDYVIQNVNPDLYYKSRFPKWTRQYHPNVCCPFHDDREPSFSVGLKNGGAKCHAPSCSRSFGNIVHFESCLQKIKEKEAARKLYREFGRKIISRKVVQEYRQHLMLDGLLILSLQKELGLKPQTVKRFALGYDPSSRRITIPVFDPWGNCVNIRFYKLPSQRTNSDDTKIYNYKQGYGTTDLFPYPHIGNYLPKIPVYLMASETEAMLAIQDGLAAVCATAGEGAWSKDGPAFFYGRDVFTVLDNDAEGQAATKKISVELVNSKANPCVVLLPFRSKRPDRKDYRDWRLKERGNPAILHKYATRKSRRLRDSGSDSAVPTISGGSGRKRVGRDDATKCPVVPEFATDDLLELASIGTNPKLLNKRIRVQGVVAAKAGNTYSIPWKFKIEIKNRPNFNFVLPFGRELLRFVRTSDAMILQTLQELLGSTAIKIQPLAYINATEVEVVPVALVDRDVPYVTQRCFYFGPDIKANTAYNFEMVPAAEIRTQETVGIITKCTPIDESSDAFELTNEIETELRGYFCPHDDETVYKKLTNIGNELSKSVTHIYNRLDWHIVALLTWASPLQLRFPDSDDIKRGWINGLAVGDTETGKSEVCKAFRRVTGTGIFVNSENCTFVGLIGGAIKTGGDRFMLRWGRIPLSDKQLVILEELSGLSVQEISNMSDVRSSGIARLDKGGINSQTNSRTRLLCLSNVRGLGKRQTLANYLYGIYAVQELIGHGEDIARFDLITTLVDSEVDIGTINNTEFATIANESNLGLEFALRNLIKYIWSLKPDDIKFTNSSWIECLNQTKELANVYHPSIPVFKGGSGRYKLGRIAAAIACLQFSRRANKIIVLRNHVKAAAKFLRFIYDKASFGYRQYSEQMYQKERILYAKELAQEFRQKIQAKYLSPTIGQLIHITRFSRDELASVAGLTLFGADSLIGCMLRSNVLAKDNSNNNIWAITPPGKAWLEQFKFKSNGTHQ